MTYWSEETKAAAENVRQIQEGDMSSKTTSEIRWKDFEEKEKLKVVWGVWWRMALISSVAWVVFAVIAVLVVAA